MRLSTLPSRFGLLLGFLLGLRFLDRADENSTIREHNDFLHAAMMPWNISHNNTPEFAGLAQTKVRTEVRDFLFQTFDVHQTPHTGPPCGLWSMFHRLRYSTLGRNRLFMFSLSTCPSTNERFILPRCFLNIFCFL